ncbi:MAG: MFS transporter, partial [archaeon]|nr:MFS transporter [archaeon]
MLKLLKNKSLINRNTIILFSIYSNSLAIYQVFATMQTDFVRNIIDITEISQLNNIRSVFMLVLAFTAFPWAYFAEKIKRKNLLIISSLFNFFGPLLSAFCTSYSELILFQIISGIGYAGSVNLTRIMILDVVPRKESGRVY